MPRKKKKNPDNFFLHSILSIIIFALILSAALFIRKNIICENKKPLNYYKYEDLIIPKDIKEESEKENTQIKIPILMYHYVENIKDPNDTTRKGLNTPPKIFEEQLKNIKNASYESIFHKDLSNFLLIKKELPKKPIMLTFDDGYKDFYSDVFPLLKKYQVKATVYVIVDFLGRKDFLTKEQIKEMSDSNLVEIASHTLSHVYLKTSPEEIAKSEILESKIILENILNKPVYDFAYPYGAFNEKTKEIVKKAGYLSAVSVIPGNVQGFNNRYYLHRLRPGIRTGEYLINWLENYK